MAQLTIVTDKAAMSDAAAERITTAIESAVSTRGNAAVSLTGGDTPDLLYASLADGGRPWRSRIDWQRLHVFWGDERAVPPHHPESNYGLAHRLLLQHVDVPAEHIHRMRGELSATDAGALYDDELHAYQQRQTGPLFDVMLLGIGSNAHIASLFPGSSLLSQTGAREPLAAGIFVPELSRWRITMTPRALLDARRIIMIASGPSKAEAIAAALEQPLDVLHYPAQLLREAGEAVEWIIDADAAARLRAAPPA
jgi:6-phosphogluconolactonase